MYICMIVKTVKRKYIRWRLRSSFLILLVNPLFNALSCHEGGVIYDIQKVLFMSSG
jgi:hypothetical protein